MIISQTNSNQCCAEAFNKLKPYHLKEAHSLKDLFDKVTIVHDPKQVQRAKPRSVYAAASSGCLNVYIWSENLLILAPGAIANTFIHEFLHVLGYKHGDQAFKDIDEACDNTGGFWPINTDKI
jgi:hypothetical protein